LSSIQHLGELLRSRQNCQAGRGPSGTFIAVSQARQLE